MVSARWTRVEFTTYDGLKLRGNWFAAARNAATSNGSEGDDAPAVIMTQGLALLKEHYLQNWAERFQDAGFNVLTYDHRNFGDSEGYPRNEVDLQLQADDYSDAVTFVRAQDGVNDAKIFLWGIGHSGGAAGTAAAFDRRIAGVILVMPSQSGKFDYDNWPSHLRERYEATRDMRRDAAEAKDDYWRFWPASAADRAGQGESMLTDDVSYNWAQGAFRLTDEGGSTFDNKVAITSLHSIFRARPGIYFKEISPTPVLFLAATDDPVATDFATQVRTYGEMGEPKEFVALNGGHLASYFGAQFEVGLKAMLIWLLKHSQETPREGQ